LWYGTGFIVLTGMFNITHHFYYFGFERLGMRARVACSTLIYRKVSQTWIVLVSTF
jgi:hypothetical protein